mmetsp:Transcript_39802/g.102516  ORF Transcript_39802/g.102516 Transcript_39802/m.102516 type:complete len:352 (-) Transcript_39802:771-1826(-)
MDVVCPAPTSSQNHTRKSTETKKVEKAPVERISQRKYLSNCVRNYLTEGNWASLRSFPPDQPLDLECLVSNRTVHICSLRHLVYLMGDAYPSSEWVTASHLVYQGRFRTFRRFPVSFSSIPFTRVEDSDIVTCFKTHGAKLEGLVYAELFRHYPCLLACDVIDAFGLSAVLRSPVLLSRMQLTSESLLSYLQAPHPMLGRTLSSCLLCPSVHSNPEWEVLTHLRHLSEPLLRRDYDRISSVVRNLSVPPAIPKHYSYIYSIVEMVQRVPWLYHARSRDDILEFEHSPLFLRVLYLLLGSNDLVCAWLHFHISHISDDPSTLPALQEKEFWMHYDDVLQRHHSSSCELAASL